jgi:hypothetical protein
MNPCFRLYSIKQRSSKRDASDVTFVSIHVRRTDYAHHLSVLYNISFVDIDYFNTTVQVCRQKYKVQTTY